MTADLPLAGKRVLVTGGVGFIGSHLVDRLSERCERLSVISRRPDANAGDAAMLVGDLRDAAFVTRAVGEAQPNIIFHLAAFKHRGGGAETLGEAVEANLLGTLNLLLAARALPSLQAVVALGTADEYGQMPAPFAESARERPLSAYGFSKQCATHLCELFHAAHGLPVSVLRPTVAYGPGQGTEMFIPALVTALLAGQTFPMTAGEQIRDFVYVSDVVDALLAAASEPRAAGRVINIGSGLSISIAAVAKRVESLIGSSGRALVGALPYRPGEAMNYVVDTALATQLLGWRPRVGLDEGLEATVDWFRARQ